MAPFHPSVIWKLANAVVCPELEARTAIDAIMAIGTSDLRDVKSALATILAVEDDVIQRPEDANACQVSRDLAATDAKKDGF